MFSGDIELNPGPTPVLYLCNSVQNNSPTKLSSNVVLEAKVKIRGGWVTIPACIASHYYSQLRF
jgi:hypothetical protein